MHKDIINNSRKIRRKMDVSTPLSLYLACPQAKADIDNHVHMFREREVSIKTKYGHSSIMIIIIIAIFNIIELLMRK